jgi:hypothetical protein
VSPPAPGPPPPPSSPPVSELPERRGPPATRPPPTSQPFALAPAPRHSMSTGRHLRTASVLLLLSILVLGIGYPLLSAGLGTLLHAPAYPASPASAPPVNNSSTNATLGLGGGEGAPIFGPALGPASARMTAEAPLSGPDRRGP